MKGRPDHIINKFKARWRAYEVARILLISLGPAIFIYFVLQSLLGSVLMFIVSTILISMIIRPWKIKPESVAHYFDHSITELEHSSWLLLENPSKLSGLAIIQRQKVASAIENEVSDTNPPTRFTSAFLIFLTLTILGLASQKLNLSSLFSNKSSENGKEQRIDFQPIDSIDKKSKIPKILNQEIIINYPDYTGLASVKSSVMNVKAVEGSKLQWKISFDTIIARASIHIESESEIMEFSENYYSKTLDLKNSAFYNFRFTDANQKQHLSELYAIESIKDFPPEISVNGIEEFQSFEFFEPKIVDLSVLITDDFGVSAAEIVATLSSGEGEAVQFREERLAFDNSIDRGAKKAILNKRIDMDQFKMKPGDELYFFIQATDLKTPKPNIARSETYFVVVKDTMEIGEGVEGSLGADLMPDYFRSQRQLIIDTKKLISEKRTLTQKDFKFRSNELGFDQKALRLKYGQFMGDENDSGIAIPDEEEISAQLEHEDEGASEDILEDYTHKHDSEEHIDNAGLQQEEDVEEDPLHKYLHDHSDPESSTLFEKSVKAKMMEAMSEMWDAELYLRLYEPQKSLPYQYKALNLIQEIKNSARIYVHRIGFDPPPIKEDSRLTGEIKEVGNYTKREKIENQSKYQSIKLAIGVLENIINNDSGISASDKTIFDKAANEMSVFAVEQPMNYLVALENLKWLSEGIVKSKTVLKSVQKTLINSINESDYVPGKFPVYKSDLDQLLLKSLSIDD